MALNQHQRAVGAFRDRRDAEGALHDLREVGFPMDRVSAVNQQEMANVPPTTPSGHKADEGATAGALSGGVFGGLTGLFVGLGALALPGIGPVMLAGALTTTLATALSGTAIGAVTGGLLGALVGLGIPEEEARGYSERIGRGDHLVIVDGTEEEIARAERILSQRGIEDFAVYNRPEEMAAPAAHVLTTTGNPVVRGLDLARNQYAAGLFSHRLDVEGAIADLRGAGFPLNRVLLIAKQFEPLAPLAGVELHHRFEPMRMGFSEERARYYYDRVDRGDYLLIVNGTSAELAQANLILQGRRIEEFRIYDASAIESDRTGYGYMGLDAELDDRHPPSAVIISSHPEVVVIDHRHEG